MQRNMRMGRVCTVQIHARVLILPAQVLIKLGPKISVEDKRSSDNDERILT